MNFDFLGGVTLERELLSRVVTLDRAWVHPVFFRSLIDQFMLRWLIYQAELGITMFVEGYPDHLLQDGTGNY